MIIMKTLLTETDNSKSFLKSTKKWDQNSDKVSGNFATKMDKMIKKLCGNVTIAERFYNGHRYKIRFSVYDKKKDTVTNWWMAESTTSSKLIIYKNVYKYDDKYRGGVSSIQEPTISKSSGYFWMSYEPQESAEFYVKGVGSILQVFYDEAKKMK